MSVAGARPKLINLAPAASTDVCRWLFRHWGMDLRESLHVPVFHLIPMALYNTSNDRRPLVVDGSLRLRTEADIVYHYDPLVAAERRLIPDGPTRHAVIRETTLAQRNMRAGVIRYMYFNLLKDRELVWRSFTLDAPWYEGFLASLSWPLIKWGLSVNLRLSEKRAAASLVKVRRAYDRAEGMMADGRPYLTGDRFTLADLTFAASGAPIMLARGYAGHLPKIDTLPDHMQTEIQWFRDHPTGAYIQRMYDDHRTG